MVMNSLYKNVYMLLPFYLICCGREARPEYWMTAICSVILSCKKKLQNWGKLGINSVLGLNDKQTMPDSSIYLKGECKKAGLREPTKKKKSGMIFHFGLSFREKNKTDKL